MLQNVCENCVRILEAPSALYVRYLVKKVKETATENPHAYIEKPTSHCLVRILVPRHNCCENHCNVAECVRKLRTDFERREAPLTPYIRILIDKPKREKPKTMYTLENIAAVAESVCEAPSTSIHRRSQ